MRLYVEDSKKKEKIYIKNVAATKRDLYQTIASKNIKIDDSVYPIKDIKAEVSVNSTIPMAIGGTLGLVGGFWGAAIGATVGGLYGKHDLNEDLKKVETFNKSKI